MSDSTQFLAVVADDGEYKKVFPIGERQRANEHFNALAQAGKEVFLCLCSIKTGNLVTLRHRLVEPPVPCDTIPAALPPPAAQSVPSAPPPSPSAAPSASRETIPAARPQPDAPSASDRLAQDLTAPLRAIRGYARLVVQKHAAALGAEAKQFLARIDENAQRSAAFVSAVACFAAIGSQPLDRVRVQPAEIVREVLTETSPASSAELEVTVAELPPCEADPALLKLLYVQLISNALKFSAGRYPQLVEIGAAVGEGEPAYFVRDNGIGFDAEAAEGRLFGLCQRLHTRSDLPGDGIGLAIASRIVERHGGRIWARAAAEKGATFFFTLSAAVKQAPAANDASTRPSDPDATDPGRDGFAAALRRAYEDYVVLLARYQWCRRYRTFLERPAGALLTALCPSDAVLDRLIEEVSALQSRQDALIAKLQTMRSQQPASLERFRASTGARPRS